MEGSNARKCVKMKEVYKIFQQREIGLFLQIFLQENFKSSNFVS